MIPLHVNWSVELRQLLLDLRVEVNGIKIPDWPHCLLPAMDVVQSLNAGSSQQRPARQVEVQVHFAFATTDGLASDHELTRCWGSASREARPGSWRWHAFVTWVVPSASFDTMPCANAFRRG